MLKIKDNVDLKELEKYGFVSGVLDYAYKTFEDSNYADVQFRIMSDRRIYLVDDEDIYNGGNKNVFDMLTLLYDLIKDNLVEKVGDDKE